MTMNCVRGLGVGAVLMAGVAGCGNLTPEPTLTDSTRARLSQQLIEQGDPVNAAAILHAPGDRDRIDSAAELQRASTLVGLGRTDEGLLLARTALAARGDDPAFSIRVARLAARAGHPEVAASVYRELLARHPDDVDGLVGDGVMRAQSGDMTGAIANFQAALQRRPSDEAARTNLELATSLGARTGGASMAAAPVIAPTVILPAPATVAGAEPTPAGGASPDVAAVLAKLQAANAAIPAPKVGWTGEAASAVDAAPVSSPAASSTVAATPVVVASGSASPKLGWTGQAVADAAASAPVPADAAPVAPTAFPDAPKLGWTGQSASDAAVVADDGTVRQPPSPTKIRARTDAGAGGGSSVDVVPLPPPTPLTPARGPQLASLEPTQVTPRATDGASARLGWTGAGAPEAMTPAPTEAPKPVAAVALAPAADTGGRLGWAGAAASPPSEPPHVTADGPVAVQLAAAGSQKDAERFWESISTRHAALLSGMEPHYMEADVNGHHYWRVRTGGFADAHAAASFCAEIRRAGSACEAAF